MTKQNNILIIGKSPAALDAMQSMLKQKGYKVETTDNFEDIPSRYKLEDFDLITMGGKVPPETKAAIMQVATERKNAMRFVQGMAAIPGLVVDQIEGELAANLRDPNQAPAFQADTCTFTLSLSEPTLVLITIWWQTTFVPPNSGSDSRALRNETLPAGTSTITVPSDIPMDSSFASVRVGDAVYCFRLSTEA